MLKRTNYPRAPGELEKIRFAVEALSGQDDLCDKRVKKRYFGWQSRGVAPSLTESGCGA
ncbi:hypothetical protein [Stenotrophomonas riyadhensis]